MKYSQIKIYTGCLLPLAAFLSVFGLVLIGMLTDETGYGWLTLAAPLGLGFCALLIVWAGTVPFNMHLLKKELTEGNSEERLAHWITGPPPQEVHIGADGLVLNGKIYYWSSPFLNLTGVSLQSPANSDGLILHLDLTREYGRGMRPFALDLNVPRGREHEAEIVVKKLKELNTIPDNDE